MAKLGVKGEKKNGLFKSNVLPCRLKVIRQKYAPNCRISYMMSHDVTWSAMMSHDVTWSATLLLCDMSHSLSVFRFFDYKHPDHYKVYNL